MARKAPETAPRCMKMLARKRDRFFTPKERSSSLLLLELDLLLLGQHRVAELLGLHGRQRGQLQRHDGAVDAQQRRGARGDVHVARALLDHRAQQLVEVDLESFVMSVCPSELIDSADESTRTAPTRPAELGPQQMGLRAAVASAGRRGLAEPVGELVGHRDAQDLFGRRHAVEYLPDAAHAQRVHARRGWPRPSARPSRRPAAPSP